MTTTIQRTSKPLKALLILANVIQLLGILGIIGEIANEASIAPGAWTLAIGVALHILGKALIWWNHG